MQFICYVGKCFSIILTALSMLTRVYKEYLGNILKHTHAWPLHKINEIIRSTSGSWAIFEAPRWSHWLPGMSG